jgi:hypothetical protein
VVRRLGQEDEEHGQVPVGGLRRDDRDEVAVNAGKTAVWNKESWTFTATTYIACSLTKGYKKRCIRAPLPASRATINLPQKQR